MVSSSPNRAEGQEFQPLVRQSSLYNLTFDEVQSHLGNLGKPLNNMYLDELVKNVVCIEEGQMLQNPSSSSSSSSSSYAPFFVGNFTLNRTLSKKTVDEVWKEIVHHENVGAMENQFVQQQGTLGETTLHNFLRAAGVINVVGDNNNNQNCVLNPQPLVAIDPMPNQADWLQLQMAAVQRYQQRQQQMGVMDSDFNVSEAFNETPVMDVGYPESQLAVAMAVPTTISASSSGSPRKRQHSDLVEKSIERRQKRMIKNRESAARSRARKQAYTNQLESEVAQLREMNSRLKRQKEVEMVLSSKIKLPKYQLRRTSSASF